MDQQTEQPTPEPLPPPSIPPPQEFTGAEVSVTAHPHPACRIELRVKASSNLVQNARKKATHLVAKEVSLPGFRKGRAPPDMVARKFPSQIDKAWQEEIANAAFHSSMHLVKIPLLNPETKVSFQMLKHSEEGADLTLFFETTPTVPTVDPKALQLKEIEKPAIDSAKVDEIIRQLRFFFATWEEVQNRPVEEGDYVLLDVHSLDTEPPTPIFTGTRFEVSEKGMAHWMHKATLGLQSGAEAMAVSTPDPGVSEEEAKNFTPKKVRLTVKKIELAHLPEVDEAFAQKLGVDTVPLLRERIEAMLKTQVEDHVRKELREQVSTWLLAHYTFDLPHSLIEKEIRFRVEQISRDPQFIKQWESINADERKNIIALIQNQSEKAVRLFYLCRKILLDHNISISPEDLPPLPKTPLETLLQPQTQTLFQDTSDIGRAETFSRLVLEKAEDYVITHCSSPIA